MDYLSGWSFGGILELALKTADEEIFLKSISSENVRQINRHLHQFLFREQPLCWDVLKNNAAEIRKSLIDGKLLHESIPWLDLSVANFRPTYILHVVEQTQRLYLTSIILGVLENPLSNYFFVKYKAQFSEIKKNLATYQTQAREAEIATQTSNNFDPRPDITNPADCSKILLKIKALISPAVQPKLPSSTFTITNYSPISRVSQTGEKTYLFIDECTNFPPQSVPPTLHRSSYNPGYFNSHSQNLSPTPHPPPRLPIEMYLSDDSPNKRDQSSLEITQSRSSFYYNNDDTIPSENDSALISSVCGNLKNNFKS